MPSFYFTFRDGALGYYCPRCDKRCCRGPLMVDRDSAAIFADRPRLRLFTRAARSPSMVVLEQFDQRCTHLASDGDCSIQRAVGYDAKPIFCRLFPVSELHRLAGLETIVVTPHFLCPIEVVEPGRDVYPMEHAGPRAALEASDVERLPAQPVRLPTGVPVRFLELEAACRDADPFAADADYIDYAARQLVRSAYWMGGLESTDLATQDVANARADLLVHLASVGQVLGCPPPPALSSQATRCLIAMTGTLRFYLLTTLVEQSYEATMERIPFALCTLAWLAAHQLDVIRETTGRTPELTPGMVYELWRRMGRRALFFAHGLSVPYLDSLPDLPSDAPRREALERFGLAVAADEEARRAHLATQIGEPRPARNLLSYLELAEPDPAARSELAQAIVEHFTLRLHTI